LRKQTVVELENQPQTPCRQIIDAYQKLSEMCKEDGNIIRTERYLSKAQEITRQTEKLHEHPTVEN
jgi:hypothetical protein